MSAKDELLKESPWVEGAWGFISLKTSGRQHRTLASALSLLSDGGAGVFIHQLGPYVIWKLLPGGQTQKL